MTKKTDATKDLPARPLSPYLLWLQDNIQALKKKHPKFTVSQMEKHVSELWTQQTDEVKAIYTQRGLAARVKFAVDMVGHMKKFTGNDKPKGSAQNTTRSESKPDSKTKKVKKASAKSKPAAKVASKVQANLAKSKLVKKVSNTAEKPNNTTAAKSFAATKVKIQNKKVKKAVQEKAKKVVKAVTKIQRAKTVAAPIVLEQTKIPAKPVKVAKKTALPVKSVKKAQ